MSDDIFDFDIDSELAKVEDKVLKKAHEVPDIVLDEDDCEGCKI